MQHKYMLQITELFVIFFVRIHHPTCATPPLSIFKYHKTFIRIHGWYFLTEGRPATQSSHKQLTVIKLNANERQDLHVCFYRAAWYPTGPEPDQNWKWRCLQLNSHDLITVKEKKKKIKHAWIIGPDSPSAHSLLATWLTAFCLLPVYAVHSFSHIQSQTKRQPHEHICPQSQHRHNQSCLAKDKLPDT